MAHPAARIPLLAATFAGLVLSACQPEPPKIQGTPETPPDPVDTDVVTALRQPDIEVEPTDLGFGSRPPECPSEPKQLTIRNVGNNPLDIASIEIAGAQAGAYTILGTPPGRLRAGEEATVDLVFTPSAFIDFDDARVVITSNDPDEGTVRVPLRGAGANFETAEDQFLQQQADAVDVLFVLDNSGSMSTAIGQLRSTINTFITSFVNLGLDYRIAVTTTHADAPTPQESGQPTPTIAGAQGAFVGPWMAGTSGQTTVTNTFQSQANTVLSQVGDSGAGDNEQAFRSTRLALSAPRINQAPNAGFLRANANLAIAIISDEDDFSNVSAPDLVNFLAGLKGGDVSKISVSAMSGPAGGGLSACGGSFFGPQSATQAPKYHAAIRQSGGIWGNYCTFDIQPFLRFLSFVAAGLLVDFPLSETPLSFTPQAITVQICDASGTCVTVPASAIDGWTYDQATNSIELNGTFIADPGDSVVITYPVPSSCPA